MKLDENIAERIEESYQNVLNERANGKSIYNDDCITKIADFISQLKRKSIIETSCYGVYLFFKDIKGLKITENDYKWVIE